MEDAKMTKHAMLKQIDGIAFVAKRESSHWVTMDGPKSVGGTEAGSRPKELVLYALAGCTASDVVNILKKKRVPLRGFEMYLTGEEAEQHPKVFTRIHVEYVFCGDGINSADKVKITHSYRIEPARVTGVSSSPAN